MKTNIIPTIYEALAYDSAAKRKNKPLFRNIRLLKAELEKQKKTNELFQVDIEKNKEKYRKTLQETRELQGTTVFPYTVEKVYKDEEDDIHYGQIAMAPSQKALAKIMNKQMKVKRTTLFPNKADTKITQQDISSLMLNKTKVEVPFKEKYTIVETEDTVLQDEREGNYLFLFDKKEVQPIFKLKRDLFGLQEEKN